MKPSPLRTTPDDQAAGAPLTSWYTQGVTDGFGDRLLMFDNAATGPVELLRVRSDFSSVPGFESALRARFDQLASFTHPNFAQARVVNQLENGGGLTVASTHVTGTRLSELFVSTRPTPGMHPESVREAFGDLVAAIAELHRHGRNVSHGAIGAERILLTFDRQLVVTDYVFGEALQRLNLTPAQLWNEFGLVADTQTGLTRLDQRGDLAQLGILMLALVLGRRIGPDEYPHKVPALLRDFSIASDRRAPDATTPLRSWLEQALDPAGFRTADEAERGLLLRPRHSHSINVQAPPARLTAPRVTEPEPVAPASAVVVPPTVNAEPALVAESPHIAAPPAFVDESSSVATPAPVVEPETRTSVTAIDDVTPVVEALAMEIPPVMSPDVDLLDVDSLDLSLQDVAALDEDSPDLASLDLALQNIASLVGSMRGEGRPLEELPAIAPAVTPPQIAAPTLEAPLVIPPPVVAPPVVAPPIVAPPVVAPPVVAPPVATPIAPALAPTQPILVPPLDHPTPLIAPTVPAWEIATPTVTSSPYRSAAPSTVDLPPSRFLRVPSTPPTPPSMESLLLPAASATPAVGDAYSTTSSQRPEPFSWMSERERAKKKAEAVAPRRTGTPVKNWLTVALAILVLTQAAIIGRLLMRQSSEPIANTESASTPEKTAPSSAVGTDAPRATRPPGPSSPATPPTASAPAAGATSQTDTTQAASTPQPNESASAETPSSTQDVRIAGGGMGGLRVISPIPLQVMSGNQFLGTSGLGPVFTKAGMRELDFINNPLGFRVKQRVFIAADRVVPLRINPPNGSLVITSRPTAQVWIDGRPSGDTPLTTSVALGDHEVVFQNAQYGIKRQKAVVQVGAPTHVTASFIP